MVSIIGFHPFKIVPQIKIDPAIKRVGRPTLSSSILWVDVRLKIWYMSYSLTVHLDVSEEGDDHQNLG